MAAQNSPAEKAPRDKWVPTEFPFRLVVYRATSAPGMQGWRNDTPRMFNDLDAAIAEAKKPQGMNILSVEVTEAGNPETWNVNGYWIKRFKRTAYNKGKGAK